MSRFRKISLTIWHCQYHLVWVPKYSHRILTGHVGHEVGNCMRPFSQQKELEIVEKNIQLDHAHLLVMIPSKVSVSDYCRTVKGWSQSGYSTSSNTSNCAPIGVIISEPKGIVWIPRVWIPR